MREDAEGILQKHQQSLVNSNIFFVIFRVSGIHRRERGEAKVSKEKCLNERSVLPHCLSIFRLLINRSAKSAPFIPQGFQSNPFSAPSLSHSKGEVDIQTPPGSPKSHLPYAPLPSTPPGSPKSHLPYAPLPSTPPGSPKSHLPYAPLPSTPPGSPKSHLPYAPHIDSPFLPLPASHSNNLAEKAFQPSADSLSSVRCKSSASSIPRIALLFTLVLFSTHCHLSLQLASFLIHLLLCGIQPSSSSSSSSSSSTSLRSPNSASSSSSSSSFDSPASVFTFACHVLDASSWLAYLFPVFFPLGFDCSPRSFPSSPSFRFSHAPIAFRRLSIAFSLRVLPNR